MQLMYIIMFCILMVGGTYFTIKISFLQFHPFKLAYVLVKAPRHIKNNFYLSLGGIMGAGNIVGVAFAIEQGGAGSVFWMCLSAVVCSSLKYLEIYDSLTAKHKYTGTRYADMDKSFGPLNYIGRLPTFSKVLGVMFCICCVTSTFTTGGMIQASAIGQSFEHDTRMLMLSAITFTVIVIYVSCVAKNGAVKFCSVVVPVMTFVYLSTCFAVVCINITELPGVIQTIIKAAFGFNGQNRGMVWGGMSGLILSMRNGFSIGLLSHEAGMGTAAIAHCDTQQKNPRVCASLGILEVYADTLVGGLATALCILLTKTNSVIGAFESVFGGFGRGVVMLTLFFFALSSCVTWYCYGLGASKVIGLFYIPVYIIAYGAAVFFAFFISPSWIYIMSDVANGVMAVINVASLYIYNAVRAKRL